MAPFIGVLSSPYFTHRILSELAEFHDENT